MHRRLKALVVIFYLALGSASPALAANLVSISDVTIVPGESFSLSVEIQTDVDLAGWHVILHWSSRMIRCDSLWIHKENFDPRYRYPNPTIDKAARVISIAAAPSITDLPSPIPVGTYQIATLYFSSDSSAGDVTVTVGAGTIPVGSFMDQSNFGGLNNETILPDFDPGIVTIGAGGPDIPRPPFTLGQSRPSPFVTYRDSETLIPFTLEDPDRVDITMYNSLGQQIRTLASDTYPSGDHVVPWDGRDRDGRLLPSGHYFYRMTTRRGSQTRGMILIK